MNHNNHNGLTHQNDPNNPNQPLNHDTGKASERASKALHKIDQIIPHDPENDMVQAIKHDALETPAAILSASKDVKDLRSRGQRTLFESRGRNKTRNNGNTGGRGNGKKKDRFLRRRLDQAYIASQAATNMMPDEVQGEDSGTTGVRAMVQEGAKIVKIFATAESAPKESKMRHVEDGQRLVHENTAEASQLTHEEVDTATPLQHEHFGNRQDDKKDANKDGKKDNANNKTENRQPKTDNDSKPSGNQDSSNTSNPSRYKHDARCSARRGFRHNRR